jgi:hypothetical protein
MNIYMRNKLRKNNPITRKRKKIKIIKKLNMNKKNQILTVDTIALFSKKI